MPDKNWTSMGKPRPYPELDSMSYRQRERAALTEIEHAHGVHLGLGDGIIVDRTGPRMEITFIDRDDA